METFAVNTTYVTLKHQYTWGCPVYVIEARLQNANIHGLPKWDIRLCTVIYLGHSHFHSRLVALILNPLTGTVSPQYYVVFHDGFLTFLFMLEGSISLNWVELFQQILKGGTLHMLLLDIEEDLSEVPSNEPL